MIKDTLKETLPYTALIRDKMIAQVEKTIIIPTGSSANGEFVAGADYAKKEIIKSLREINLQ